MGADSSKCGAIKITLDKYVNTPGEPVKGMINVIVFQPIPPCQIQFGFKGVEEIRWSESRTVRRPPAVPRRTRYPGQAGPGHFGYGGQLVTQTVPLNPGSFVIPFTFTTPQGIPGSFFYNRFSSTFSVVYKVYVRLIAKDIKLRDKQVIGIINEFPLNRAIQEPTRANLKTWWFINKGRIELHIRWINDVYSIGNPIQCSLSVDNSHGKIKVKNISAHVYCVIIATASTGYTKRVPITILKSIFDISVDKEENKTDNNAIPFTFNLEESASSTDILNVHTNNGYALKCNFFLEFELKMKNPCLCCGDAPKITREFFVKGQGKYEVPDIPVPQGWNPEIHESVQISYSPSNEAGEKGVTMLMQGRKENDSLLNKTAL